LPHSERLPSYRATSTRALDGCSLRIRPRRQTSRTGSLRDPPASASTARRVPSWLEDRFHHLAVTEDEPPEMRTTNSCQTHDIDAHPRLVRRPTPSSLRPWLRCVARFHGAPHASATCSRSLQGVFSPAVVALEQPASDAPRHPTSHALDFARTLRALAFARTPTKLGRDRFRRSLVKREGLRRPEAPSIDR